MRSAVMLAIRALLAMPVLTPAAAHAGSFTSLYSFAGTFDGAAPGSGVIYRNGSLYGGTPRAGNGSQGTLYRFDLRKHREITLYSFSTIYSSPGMMPGDEVLAYHDHIAYGTLVSGTAENGTVFAASLVTGAVQPLYRFGNPPGPCQPNGVIYVAGALYGTSSCGGAFVKGKWTGTVFEVNPSTGTQTTLYTFTGKADGGLPLTGLTYAAGALYGTTSLGGASGYGVVFKIDPVSGKETVLHSFAGAADGSAPNDLIFSNGLLYGTSRAGGANNGGTVFSIDPATGAEITLHSFGGNGDGSAPVGALASVGQLLYGTTSAGGDSNNGMLFSIDASSGAEAVLHDFEFSDGATPIGALTYAKGIVYGTTSGGGTSGNGTIFQYAP